MVIAAALAVPARADTAGDLRAARQRLVSVQADLTRMAGAYAAAESRRAELQGRIATLRRRIGGVAARMRTLRARLEVRAREAYESGGVDVVELLLTSRSFSQFSDRVQYLGSVAQGDTQLMLEASVTREQLSRSERELAHLSTQQSATVRSLGAQKRALDGKLAEASAVAARLQARLQAEQAAAARRAASTSGSGGGGGVPVAGVPLQACPVGQPRGFGDSFGQPRPGGRVHQGIDMFAPYGTPVYAAQAGRFEANTNSLGGTSALVFAPNGDYTYYAHLSSYAGVGSGASVSAGTMIGHVGNTGDAAGGPYHLHFEYHPGGGAAIDPYRYLLAVCS